MKTDFTFIFTLLDCSNIFEISQFFFPCYLPIVNVGNLSGSMQAHTHVHTNAHIADTNPSFIV